MIVADVGVVGGDKLIHRKLGAADPACRGELADLKPHRQAVFQFDSAGQNLELQRAHNPNDIARPKRRFEHFCGAFFGELHQCLFKMFGFHRIAGATVLQQFGCKAGNTVDLDHFAFGQRVADAQLSVVGYADDIAGPSLFCQFPV